MDEKEVPRERLKLKEKPDLLSPPYLAQPYACALSVTVYGFVPHATIEVEIAGVVVVSQPVGFPQPVGATLTLPAPLVAGQGVAPSCWPGLLAPQAWFLYRKMYLWAAVVSAGPLLLAYIPRLGWLNWGGALIGAFGLRLYLAHARRTIARIREAAADEAEVQALIVSAGGVSRIGAAIGLAFAFSAFVMSLKAGASHMLSLR